MFNVTSDMRAAFFLSLASLLVASCGGAGGSASTVAKVQAPRAATAGANVYSIGGTVTGLVGSGAVLMNNQPAAFQTASLSTNEPITRDLGAAPRPRALVRFAPDARVDDRDGHDRDPEERGGRANSRPSARAGRHLTSSVGPHPRGRPSRRSRAASRSPRRAPGWLPVRLVLLPQHRRRAAHRSIGAGRDET